MSVLTMIVGAALAAASYSSVRAQQPANRTVLDGVYARAQAARGETLYADTCASCHDPKLVGGMGPALAGKGFISAWKDRTVGDLFDTITTIMPLGAPGTLTAQQAVDAVSFILASNQFPAGAAELAAYAALLKAIHLAEPSASAPAAGGAPGGGLYAAAQAKRGETVYMDMCAACHDPMLVDGMGPALTGNDFVAAWKGKTVGDLFDTIKTTMPLASPGTLTPQQTADVIAYVLSVGHYPAGATELGSDEAALKAVSLGEPAQK